jgi:hypothetical protein
VSAEIVYVDGGFSQVVGGISADWMQKYNYKWVKKQKIFLDF